MIQKLYFHTQTKKKFSIWIDFLTKSDVDDYYVIDLMVLSMSFASKTTLIGPKDDSSASSHIAIVSTNAACLFR